MKKPFHNTPNEAPVHDMSLDDAPSGMSSVLSAMAVTACAGAVGYTAFIVLNLPLLVSAGLYSSAIGLSAAGVQSLNEAIRKRRRAPSSDDAPPDRAQQKGGSLQTDCRLSRWFCLQEDGSQLIFYRTRDQQDGEAPAVPDETLSGVSLCCSGLQSESRFVDGFTIVHTYETKLAVSPDNPGGKRISGRWYVADDGGRILLNVERCSADELLFCFDYPVRERIFCPHPETAGAQREFYTRFMPTMQPGGRFELPGYALYGEDAGERFEQYVRRIEAQTGLRPCARRSSESEYSIAFGSRLMLHVRTAHNEICFCLSCLAVPDGNAYQPAPRIALDPGRAKEIAAWQEAHACVFYNEQDAPHCAFDPIFDPDDADTYYFVHPHIL